MADPRDKVPPAAEPPVEPPQLALPRVPANARKTRSGRLVVDDPGDTFLRYLIDQDDPLSTREKSSFDFLPGVKRRR